MIPPLTIHHPTRTRDSLCHCASLSTVADNKTSFDERQNHPRTSVKIIMNFNSNPSTAPRDDATQWNLGNDRIEHAYSQHAFQQQQDFFTPRGETAPVPKPNFTNNNSTTVHSITSSETSGSFGATSTTPSPPPFRRTGTYEYDTKNE